MLLTIGSEAVRTSPGLRVCAGGANASAVAVSAASCDPRQLANQRVVAEVGLRWSHPALSIHGGDSYIHIAEQ